MKLHRSSASSEQPAAMSLPATVQRPVAPSYAVHLHLTIRFGQQEIKLPEGRVWFGLKRGLLKLKLENGKIPTGNMGLTPTVELELVREQPEYNQAGEANIAVAGGVSTQDAVKRSSHMMSRSCQVSTTGTEEAPVWEFAVETSEAILEGQLTEAWLGTIEANTQLSGVSATFEVWGQRDICLTHAEGLWATDISRNKEALLEREFFLRFIKPKLQPYLSQVGGAAMSEPEFQISEEAFREFQAIVRQVEAAETDNFLKLAKLLGRDPKRGFIGANLNRADLYGDFIGAYLLGADLRGANLDHVTLNNASLDGADLRGANLSHAKFSHASLRDVNLSGANLSHAILHRASLSGADLSGADLSEAQMPASAQNARFSNVVGLSEEQKLYLQQRGAIFEDDADDQESADASSPD